MVSGRTAHLKYPGFHKRNEDVIGFIQETSTIFLLDGSSHARLGYPAARRVARFLHINLGDLPKNIDEKVKVIEQVVKDASSDLIKNLPNGKV